MEKDIRVKIVEITECFDCPWRIYKDFDLHCKKVKGLKTNDSGLIPEWCPLTDAQCQYDIDG